MIRGKIEKLRFDGESTLRSGGELGKKLCQLVADGEEDGWTASLRL